MVKRTANSLINAASSMSGPTKINILICGLLIVGALIILYSIDAYLLRFRPHVKSVHVINLDKDTERWAAIQKSAPIQMERWPATYGKDLTPEQCTEYGVGHAMTRSGVGTYEEQEKTRRNQGVVGCYLSHKLLLKHLATLDVPDYYGHLILEDDAQIPANFLKPEDEWHKVYKNVPMDWDIVYLDITKPVGKMVASNVMKLEYKMGIAGGNWGTHAYIVRHGALKTKIIPWMKYMIDTIDEHYKLKFNEWNVYAAVPGIIKLNEAQAANSSIQKKE
jgi:GR25 family glycosyltransferase involved in LPS biosynthesis